MTVHVAPIPADVGQALGAQPATATSVQSPPATSARVHPGSLPTGSIVTNLDFDVTENCNLGCGYCFKGEKYTQNMSLDGMKKSLEWLLAAAGSAPTANCNFMGGEPTMRWKEIRQFVPWASRRGKAVGKRITFSMTSNLTLWNDDIRAFVDKWNFGVLMSIDGCPEVQDAQRPAKNGRPMSDVVEYWARSMLRSRPQSTARATLMPLYVGTLAKSFRYLHSIGFEEIAVSASEYDKWTPQHFQVLEQQLDEIVAYLVKLGSEGSSLHLTSLDYYIGKLIAKRRTGRDNEIKFEHAPCGAGKGYMMVDYTGDIWPCHRFDGADEAAGAGGQFRLGNIYKSGFNSELQRAFLTFDHEKVHKESCNTCPANPVCAGYCPAANLSDTGSIYTPHDAFCQWTQTMYRAAEHLHDTLRTTSESAYSRLLERAAKATTDGQR